MLVQNTDFLKISNVSKINFTNNQHVLISSETAITKDLNQSIIEKLEIDSFVHVKAEQTRIYNYSFSDLFENDLNTFLNDKDILFIEDIHLLSLAHHFVLLRFLEETTIHVVMSCNASYGEYLSIFSDN